MFWNKNKKEAAEIDAPCKYPLCEECDKYVSVSAGEMKSLCTVPIVIDKQKYLLITGILKKQSQDIIELKESVRDLEVKICDLRTPKSEPYNLSEKAENPLEIKE